MDILLTHGYFLYEDPQERKVMKPYPPLGILYISSYLKSKGFDVEVLDTTFKTRKDVTDYLAKTRPDLVGIYCNLMTKPNVLEMIQVCKRLGCTVILGGPDPPHYAKEYLTWGADVVVIGEGEMTLEELIPRLQNGSRDLADIKGIVYKGDDGTVHKTPERPFVTDLDALPFPDRDAIDLQKYINIWREHHNMGSVSLICARGCPYTCTWCSHSVYGFSHRRRSPQNVAEEVDLIVQAYQPDMLWYADDVFSIHHRWLFEYADELQQRNIRLPFECISREDRLNESVVQKLAEMGCDRLWIGSESGSQSVLDAMQRRTNVERVQEMTRLLQKYGIQAGMFIMLGYEGETLDDLEATAEHLKKANPDIFLTTVAYPIKGTGYFHEVEDRIRSRKPWEQRTDRDLLVSGRSSKRFYDFANRWLVNEVALHRRLNNGTSDYLKTAKAFINSRIGKLGMTLTKHQREDG
ncbi:B12-binding domain-containing radical SAM protein [candidate division KSB1 bacterium]|nr:B12-binding domain-containing radical SAM protein [candidate division KSB1 bacterium]NIR69273.1 B12-binding domain-containing radical SAM protein [candidate division KSB1 bacterium]NIS24134.1 B12-binding domain-containing radical SAM protein [candidate division KSB1 bacterium]NIT71048.1 B12-binding domain-containing radical SAM protein [candidate division KSB1 bacterium]NIU24753.1 B12-binding domain-containing radical SAM protein [candidate division KSB1 bacterium]